MSRRREPAETPEEDARLGDSEGKPVSAASSKGGPPEGGPNPVSAAARLQPRARPSGPERGPRPTARTARRSTTPDRAQQEAWVLRLRQGDGEALREVVLAFAERLTAVVAGVLRDRDAVEDVVQESFAKAFYRIGSFKGGSSLYTWLYRIAVNGAKDYIKSRKRRPASSFDELPGRASLPAQAPPMLEGLERRELRRKVREAIDRLPYRFRSVLALREIEGMTYNDIAEVLGLSLGTVESRLFRARKRLRATLAREHRARESSSGSKGEGAEGEELTP